MGGLESIKQTIQSTGSRIQARTSEFVRQEVPAAKQKLADSTRKGRARIGSTVREELTRFKTDRKGDLDKCRQEWSRARTTIGARVRNALGTIESDPGGGNGNGNGNGTAGSGGGGGGGTLSPRFRPRPEDAESESESEEILFGTSDPPTGTDAGKDSSAAVIPKKTFAADDDDNDDDDENNAAANPASSTLSKEGGKAESEPEMDPTKDASTKDEHEREREHEHQSQCESGNRPRCETSRQEDGASNPAPRRDEAAAATAAAANEDVPAITCQDDELVEIGSGDHTAASPPHLFNSWVVVDEDECGA